MAITDNGLRVPLRAWLLLLAALVIYLLTSLPLPVGRVIENPAHSVAKHGADAAAIHQAMNCGGPAEVWHTRSWRANKQNKFFRTCKLDDGRWGCQIVQVAGDTIREKTAFVVKDGTRVQTVEYLSAIAKCIWSKL